MAVLAVAALSARMMAEAAARDGFDVLALDLFGDADTRRAALDWLPLGEPGGLRIHPGRALAALQALAQRGDVIGWVPGSGFDGLPALWAQGAALLPLLGTEAGAVRRLRDPRLFFAELDRAGIAHPEVRFDTPPTLAGWLLKDPHACGGWHIRRATARRAAAQGQRYFQRQVAGTPMSATFIANGRDARVLGFNRLIVFRRGIRPFGFCGAIGPVPLPAVLTDTIAGIVRQLSATFTLKGLCSLDFIDDANHASVLEVNPRPPASIGLYAGQPLMRAHANACLHGTLPQRPDTASDVRGLQIVFAPRAVELTEADARRIAQWPDAHDLPRAGTRIAAHDPLCSVSAHGSSAAQVAAGLAASCQSLISTLENAR